MRSGKVVVFGVPSAAGGSGPGMELAPFALRAAGLLEALRSTGRTVVNRSDLSLFPFREDSTGPARNTAGAACAARAAADEMARALTEGFAILLGGDCSLVVGAVAGVQKTVDGPLGLVYLDANADLNTPDTSPSGGLAGMALSLALGKGPAELVALAQPPVDPDHVALVGFRALDPGERSRIADLGLALPAAAARTLGMRAAAALALDGVNNEQGPILVHLDVDLVGPAEMPAKVSTTPGDGLSWPEAGALLTALFASPRVVALEVAEYHPAGDPGGACGRLLVELIARAVSGGTTSGARHA
jgi:arginase